MQISYLLNLFNQGLKIDDLQITSEWNFKIEFQSTVEAKWILNLHNHKSTMHCRKYASNALLHHYNIANYPMTSIV